MNNLSWIRKYEPAIYFDRNEPFLPVRVGVTLLKPGERSPSFNRTVDTYDRRVETIIEYAIYWDYDIQHLYELEHVWVFVGQDGEVLDCEASFHGKFLRGLLADRSNVEDGTHVRLFSQPGKHAMLPDADWFQLVPKLYQCTYEEAGKDGLTVPGFLAGIVHTDEGINRMVEAYLKTLAFRPAMTFKRCEWSDAHYVSWPELLAEIPQRIQEQLSEIRSLHIM